MKSTDKFVLVLVASLFLLLAGCGGGGGSSSPAPMDEPDPVTPSVDLGELSIPAGDYTIDAGMSQDVGEGETEVTLTCSAAADCAFTVDEEGMATATSGEVTAALSVAAMQAIADREEDERMAKVIADTTAAGTKTTAIAAEAGEEGTADAGLGGSDALGADGVVGGADDSIYTIGFSRDDEGTTVKITDPDNPGDTDPQFTQTMDLGDGTTMHTRTMDADSDGNVVEEVVIVSTDIEAPVATAFGMVMDQGLTVRKDGETLSDTNPADSLVLTALDSATSGHPATLALIMSSGFTSPTAAELSFVGDDPDATDDEAYEVEGTYNGAMGTYTCAGGATNCTVSIDAMGMLTAISDGWIFTPDAGATSDVPDSEYMHYGVWLKKTTDGDGAVTYNEVETFAGASFDASTGSEIAEVDGSASYEGKATGVYVHEVYNAVSNIESSTSGHFTADVMLTATFGQLPVSTTDSTGTIAPNLLNTVKGTISDFVLSNGEENTWGVTVEAEIAGANFEGMAKGGLPDSDPNSDGSIKGTFYGETPFTPSTTDGGTVRTAPGSMVGEFNTFFSNGSVAGAFGATKED